MTLLEARRERLRECIRVAGVSGVARFGGTEGVRLRERARLGEFPKPYARIEHGMIRQNKKAAKPPFIFVFYGLR